MMFIAFATYKFLLLFSHIDFYLCLILLWWLGTRVNITLFRLLWDKFSQPVKESKKMNPLCLRDPLFE